MNKLRALSLKSKGRALPLLRSVLGIVGLCFRDRQVEALCTTLAQILFFREDSRLVRRAAPKQHSARQGLALKTD